MSRSGSSRRHLLFAGLAVAVLAGVVGYTVLPSDAAALPATGGDVSAGGDQERQVHRRAGRVERQRCAAAAVGLHRGAAWQQFGSSRLGQQLQAGQRQQRQVCRRARLVDGLRRAAAAVRLRRQSGQPAVAAGRQRYRHVSRSSTSTADCASATRTPRPPSGAAVIQETCTANTNKQWAFNPVGGTTAAPPSPRTARAVYRTVQAAIDAVPANNTTRRRHHHQGRHVPGDRDDAGEQAVHHPAGPRLVGGEHGHRQQPQLGRRLRHLRQRHRVRQRPRLRRDEPDHRPTTTARAARRWRLQPQRRPGDLRQRAAARQPGHACWSTTSPARTS